MTQAQTNGTHAQPQQQLSVLLPKRKKSVLELWCLVSSQELFNGNVNYMKFFSSVVDFKTYLLRETQLHCNLLVLVYSY